MLEPYTQLPAHTFNDSHPHSSEFLPKYWRQITKIKRKADQCESKMKDENAWILGVAPRVLKWESLNGDCARLEHPFLELQSMSVYFLSFCTLS